MINFRNNEIIVIRMIWKITLVSIGEF